MVDSAISIIVREVYQHPSQRGKLSFPPKALPTGAYRPYMREGALRYGLEDEEEGGFDFDPESDADETDDSDEEAEFEEEESDDEDEV